MIRPAIAADAAIHADWAPVSRKTTAGRTFGRWLDLVPMQKIL
jgi:hypothetical protein